MVDKLLYFFLSRLKSLGKHQFHYCDGPERVHGCSLVMKLRCMIFGSQISLQSRSLTAKALKSGWVWKTIFLLGPGKSSGAFVVKLPGSISHTASKKCDPKVRPLRRCAGKAWKI